jgi:hypothetical protein
MKGMIDCHDGIWLVLAGAGAGAGIGGCGELGGRGGCGIQLLAIWSFEG